MNMPRGQFRRRPVARFVPNPKLKFLDQCHEVMRFKQLAAQTEETYLQWIRRFFLFHRYGDTRMCRGQTPVRARRRHLPLPRRHVPERRLRRGLRPPAPSRTPDPLRQHLSGNRPALGSGLARAGNAFALPSRDGSRSPWPRIAALHPPRVPALATMRPIHEAFAPIRGNRLNRNDAVGIGEHTRPRVFRPAPRRSEEGAT